MIDFSNIPANACIMTSGEFALGDNGENAKSAPLTMTARSGKPIEHWYWGRVVHDLSGMSLKKSRVPVDYVHDDKEVIGYLNKFDSSSGDLVVSGALVPFKDNDRATEIIHKQKAGVPYEASINFGGDGIVIEEVPAGFIVEVNGYQFEGPGVIIRKWPLRGVAVCPYGADQNTESAIFSSNSKTFSAHVVPTKKTTTEENKMSESESVEVVASENEPVAGNEADETKKAEAAEEGAPVETPTVEAETQKVEVDETREEFKRMHAEFGAEIAAEIFASGGSYNDAMKLALDRAKHENEKLKARITELSSDQTATGTPVKVTEHKEPKKLFNTGK